MSNPQAIESLVRDLHELANEADGKNISGSAYGLSNSTAGILTGGSKKKGRKKRRKTGNSHAAKTKAYMRSHKNATLGQASHAVAQGRK